MKFDIEILSSGQADCFLVLLGNDKGDECSILIDGNCEGKKSEALDKVVERISKLKKLDCIVVTHIDNDHIGGILSLFEKDKDEKFCINEQLKESIIVYNNVTENVISFKQAERFENLIRDRKVINSFSNRYKNTKKMLYFLSVRTRKILNLNEKNNNNIYLTFLNPDKSGVKEVISDYKKYKTNDKKADAKLINKNSIIVLIEFQGKNVLFTGDTYSERVKEVIDELQEESVPYPIKTIDLIKIPHHGATEYNKSLACLSKNVECGKFILTGKSEWDNKHPSKEVLEGLLDNLSDEFGIYTEVALDSIDNKFKELQKDCRNKISLL